MTALGPGISGRLWNWGGGRADSPTRRGFSTQGLQRWGRRALKLSSRIRGPVSLEPEGVGDILGQDTIPAAIPSVSPSTPWSPVFSPLVCPDDEPQKCGEAQERDSSGGWCWQEARVRGNSLI